MEITKEADVQTYGIIERDPPELVEKMLSYEMGEMCRLDAQKFIASLKGKKLHKKLIVDFDLIYAEGN